MIYSVFHPYFLIKKKYNTIFYRNHSQFFLSLLKCLTNKKKFFLLYPHLFFDFIIKYFEKYNQQFFLQKENYDFFQNIIKIIKLMKKNKKFNLYSFLINLIGFILYHGCYNISEMIFSEYNKNNNNSINIMIQQVLEKYQYTPKIVFVSINKNLEKGAILKYKNLTIDLSLKRLYELLNKKITIHNIGEL